MKSIVLLVAVAALLGSTASAATRPRVAIDGVSPLVVVGSGFGDRSSVRVVVSAGDLRLVKAVRSSARGAFTVRWTTRIDAGSCQPVGVTAVSGSLRAVTHTVVAKTCGAPRYTP